MSMKNYLKNLDEKIEEVIDYNKGEFLHIIASVIIVTYNSNKKVLEQCLNSLKEQTFKDFEIIIVDNSDKTDLKPIVSKYICKYIKLKKNYGLSLARNIGIKFARGDIVIFLDDDAIPAHNFVEEHVSAYSKYDIFGLRGKSLPKTHAIYNYLAPHYDLGDQPIPYYIDLEGNSSFKRDVLSEIGGFNPELQGAGGCEGLELTYRIISKCKDKSKLIYYPNAVIYHDYSDTFVKYIKKQLRHAKHNNMLKCIFPDIFEFDRGYKFNSKKLKRETPSLSIRIQLRIIRKLTSFILRVQKLLNKNLDECS